MVGISYEVTKTFNPPGFKGIVFKDGIEVANTNIQETIHDCEVALKKLIANYKRLEEKEDHLKIHNKMEIDCEICWKVRGWNNSE